MPGWGDEGLVGSREVCREGGTGHPEDREEDANGQGEGSLWSPGKGKGERRADVAS